MKESINIYMIKEYHHFLDDGLSVKEISKIMKISVACLEAHAPEKHKLHKKEQRGLRKELLKKNNQKDSDQKK